MTSPAAILVGESSPILRAVALRLASRDMSIVLAGPDADQLSAVAAELEQAGYHARSLLADPAVSGEMGRMAEAARGEFGEVRVLVSCPPVPRDRAELADGEQGSCCGASLDACLRATLEVAPHLAIDGSGRIVHLVSSTARYRSGYFLAPPRSRAQEAAAGGALLALTRQLALELAPRRIRVNAVVAGLIEGSVGRPEWLAMSDRERRFVLQEISLGRLGRPDEVAAAVEFLALDASSYVTGTAIDVNGGWWMS
jgi:3-oxoacyl-[acyl-carrier protein] reductase